MFDTPCQRQRRVAVALVSRCPLLKQLLLPMVEDSWRDLIFVAQIGNRHLSEQVPPYVATFCSRVKCRHFLTLMFFSFPKWTDSFQEELQFRLKHYSVLVHREMEFLRTRLR